MKSNHVMNQSRPYLLIGSHFQVKDENDHQIEFNEEKKPLKNKKINYKNLFGKIFAHSSLH